MNISITITVSWLYHKHPFDYVQLYAQLNCIALFPWLKVEGRMLYHKNHDCLNQLVPNPCLVVSLISISIRTQIIVLCMLHFEMFVLTKWLTKYTSDSAYVHESGVYTIYFYCFNISNSQVFGCSSFRIKMLVIMYLRWPRVLYALTI